MRIEASALLCASIVAAPSAASASFAWHAPDVCPSADGMNARLGELLAHRPSATDEWQVTVEIQRAADGFQATIALDGPAGQAQRELSDTSCVALSEAVCVLIALAIDSQDEVAPAVEPEIEPPPPAPAPSWWPWAAGGIAAQVGMLPHAMVGPVLEVGLRFDALRLAIRGTLVPWAEARVPERPSAGGTFLAGWAELRGCAAADLAPVELAACGALELGAVTARGFGVSRPGSGESVWVAFGLAGVAAIEVSAGVWLRLEIGGSVPFARPVFTLLEVGTVHRSAPVVGRLAFLMVFRLV
jgi:hypothetical protein